MSLTKRKFNKEAYDTCDTQAKENIKNLIEQNSNYLCVDGIGTELYKEADLIFEHKNKKIKFSVELETRQNFNTIRDEYPTIHIPIRKQHSKADFYIVCNPKYNEFFLISQKIFDKYRYNIITQTCRGTYIEKFMEVPKNEAHFCYIDNNIIFLKGKKFRFGT